MASMHRRRNFIPSRIPRRSRRWHCSGADRQNGGSIQQAATTTIHGNPPQISDQRNGLRLDGVAVEVQTP
jgi:hypothetical protein